MKNEKYYSISKNNFTFTFYLDPIFLKYFLMPSEKDKISILYGSYKKYLPLS